MCGIAGSITRQPLGAQNVRATLELMQRRGPDFQAHEVLHSDENRHVSLLHSRLSIIDLGERAHQPFVVNGKHLIFNGEIYNYLEVREQLKRIGVQFRTDSDTEVLAHALDRWGWQGLDRLEGMWAFALYDSTDGSLLLSRDRFGEKPLYLLQDGDRGFYFASEIKFIRSLLGRPLQVNTGHLKRFLINGYKSLYKAPASFFDGIEELPRASVLKVFPNGRRELLSYWQPRLNAINEDMSIEEAIRGTRERLIRSVELRLRADVPLGFCMSGGVDSNALIAIAKRELGYNVHGFTIVNTDSRYEEKDIVDHVVKTLDLRHSAISPSREDFLPSLQTLVRQHDAPVYTITYYVHWLLMRAMRAEGYKISISGSAADELFTGYYDHHNAYFRSVANDPQRQAEAIAEWRADIGQIVRNPYLKDPLIFTKSPFERGHIYLNADEFSSYLHHPWQEPFAEEIFTTDMLRNRMLNEIFHEATPVILHEDDINAMYYSIENRSPFLDRNLFEFAYSIPTRHLIQKGRAKYVLREAMRGIAPDMVIDNARKVGFNAPIEDLLDAQNPAIRDSLLADSPIFDVIRRDKISDALNQRDMPNSMSKFLFNFVSTKLFMDEFAA